eukprot:6608991-Prymnesium_polylepis.1
MSLYAVSPSSINDSSIVSSRPSTESKSVEKAVIQAPGDDERPSPRTARRQSSTPPVTSESSTPPRCIIFERILPSAQRSAQKWSVRTYEHLVIFLKHSFLSLSSRR